jgi:hypothetical protein
MLLNVVNPHKSKNYFVPCRVCKLKNCNNCHLPLNKTQTLREFLTYLTHKTKFNENANLFRNVDEVREEENNEKYDDNEETKNNWTTHNNGHWNSQQSSSINADNDEDDTENAVKESDSGRHRTFQLELVFINRRLDKPTDYYNKTLMGFDTHPIKKDKQKFHSSSHSQSKQHGNETLQGCLEAYRKKTKLDKDNAWYCNVCKEHVEATKQIEIYNVPPILIFCFQRFKSHGMYFKEKMEDTVDFPLENLDLTPYVVSEQ